MVDLKPLFSIILPCYNSALYVENAIVSVLNQTYNKLELLIIDDGSTDDTLSILNKYAIDDNRVKVFHKENGGYPSAINYGLDRITGDYFLFMGSDDELCLDLLENAHTCLEKKAIDMVAFKVIMHDLNRDKFDRIDPSTLFRQSIYYNGIYAAFYAEHKYEASFFATRDTGKIYNRKLLDNLRYFGFSGLDADGIFSLLFAHKCHSFCVMPVEGYIWNLHADSLSGRKKTSATQMDRLNNWTMFVKSIIRTPKNELAEIDYVYSKTGHKIVCYFAQYYRKIFLKRYYVICSYYFYLRRLWVKKKGLKYFKHFLLCSFLPILLLLFKND